MVSGLACGSGTRAPLWPILPSTDTRVVYNGYIERKLAHSLVAEGRSGSSWGFQVRSSSDRAGGTLRPGPRRKETWQFYHTVTPREDRDSTEPEARRADFGSAGPRLFLESIIYRLRNTLNGNRPS